MSQKPNTDTPVPSTLPTEAAPAAPEPPKTVTIPETELTQLKADAAKATENWDKFLRAAADHENFRKRVVREKEELSRAAREAVISTLLPALDNLERALDHSPEGTPLHEGLLQVQKQFERALGEFGLIEITAKPGDPFNPVLHEAISHIESNDHPDGTVIQQIQSGYKLGDKLLRAARVAVSKGLPAVAGNSATEGAAPSAPPSAEKSPEKKNSWFKSPFNK